MCIIKKGPATGIERFLIMNMIKKKKKVVELNAGFLESLIRYESKTGILYPHRQSIIAIADDTVLIDK